MCLPSAGPHSAAQTLRVRSLVWSGADGLAVQQNKICFNLLKFCLIQCLFCTTTVNEGGRIGSTKYPWRAADNIRELFDELACAGDDFIGLLLRGVSEENTEEERQKKESDFTELGQLK